MAAPVLINRRAGRAGPRMLAALRAATPRLIVTDSAAEADEALAELVATGARRIVLGGGDGTLVAGLAAIARAATAHGAPEPVVGVLALGTGNAVARTIGARAPRPADVGAALARAEVAAPIELPMLDLLGRRAPFCGFGLDAQLVADADAVATTLARARVRLPAALRYALAVPLVSVPRFVRTARPTVTIHRRGAAAHVDGAAATDAVLWSGACTLAACSTIPYFGFGLQMFAFARTRADRFQVRAGDPGLGEVVASAPAAFRGRYRSPRVHDFLCDAVTLALDRPAPFEIAGDVVGTLASVDVRLGRAARLVAV
ncbi:MAG: hypothetical protein JNK64_16090 [Myxococcales bacterium]|nr:hypothetical protein [Myxococcales bacterium]